MGLLSVQTGSDGVCRQRKASQSLNNMEVQEECVATRGRCVTLVRVTAMCEALFVPFFFSFKCSFSDELQRGVFLFVLTLVFTSTLSEWKARAAIYGWNAGEEAQAAAGREESKKGSAKPKPSAVSKCEALQSAAHTLILFSQAASRGWNTYHAVLYRHTLCFYQDRKDTLRVSRKRKKKTAAIRVLENRDGE